MKLILKKRVINLGHEGDTVTVKNGYGRNYLLPQGLAEFATPGRLKVAEKKVAERLKMTEEVVANAKEIAGKLEDIKLHFKKKARGKKLYGSITEKDIMDALKKDHKLEINKEMIKMDHLKELGEHKVTTELTEGVAPKIKVLIEAE